tara:strand:- start:42 stop:479 length:438 start_codon:yes stop_codon:yes gene_type:complete
MGKFNSAKQFIGQIFSGKVSPTITKVKPNVGNPSKSALNKQIQKTKASGAKLAQTLFESKNKAFKGDDFTFAKSTKKTPKVSEQKAKGGRVGLKLGTKKKSNVEKIKKTFGTLSVRAGIDNNPNPTYADKIAGAKMKNKKKKKII